MVAAPTLDPVRLVDLVDADPASIRAHEHHEGMRYADARLAGANLGGVSFGECLLTGADLDGTDLRGSRFVESRLERAAAAVLEAGHTTWRDVEIDASRFGAVEWYDAELRSVRVTGCKLSFVNLRGSKLLDVRFDECVIDELDLSDVTAERVAFADTTVGSLRLDRARLKHVDLRGLDLRTISGIDAMRGAVVSAGQATDLASAFAAHLGITVVGD